MRIGNVVSVKVTFWVTSSNGALAPFDVLVSLPITPSIAFGGNGEKRVSGQGNIVQLSGTGRVAINVTGETGNFIRAYSGSTLTSGAGNDYRVMVDCSYSLA
eukprot:TRINITY_DN2546_c0_g2_i1.p1 TRINITY_DN2546_c0_g2~~TRINITY_DN2546_c0_g2_i1.p1  ORF type:complete len:117 (-),score=20.96 TRINITY_DN2546_c0_g2_i1:42-347(-)